jgi:hypothetical protein
MPVRQLCSILLFTFLGAVRGANAQIECVQNSQEWNAYLGKTAIYFTNTCQQTVNLTLVSGNNRTWGLLLLPSSKSFGLFYQEDAASLGGVFLFPCFDPAYPVDGQGSRVSRPSPTYSCKNP